MSSITREASVASGAPVECYAFDQAGGASFRYTGADVPVVRDTVTYTPVALLRSAIKPGEGIAGWTVDIELPADDPLALLFRGVTSPVPITVLIYRLHRGETDSWQVFPAGKVRTCSVADGIATLHCTDLESDLDLPIPATTLQRNCPWMLYGTRCGLNANDFRAGFAVASVAPGADGTQIIGLDLGTPPFDTHLPPNYYLAGLADQGTGQPSTFIIEQPDDHSVRVLTPFDDVHVGDTIFLTAGCDRTSDDCHDKFNNVEHFGGLPGLNPRNPYGDGGLR